MKIRIILLLSIALIIFLTWQNLLPLGCEPTWATEEKEEVLKILLPQEGEVSGWKLSSPPRFFHPSNLWEYINGQSELYLNYGFQLVVTSDFTSKQDSNSLTIEIYQMKSPYHAFGIYAAERSPEEHFIEVGVQGYITEDILNFWKGPYYVKITSLQISPAVKEALLSFSKAIANKIKGNYSEPELFACFPQENKIEISERFIPQNFLGHQFLKNGYRVDYQWEGNRYQVFLAENSSTAEAEEAFGRYQAFFKSERKIVSYERKPDHQKVRIENKKKKIVFQYKSVVGGVLDIVDFSKGEEIIEEVLKKLRNRH